MKKKLLIVLFVCASMTAAAADYAPRFLAYADTPVKSDAVILFLGGEFMVRETEAFQLLSKGYARFLIVPAFHQMLILDHMPRPVANIEVAASKTIPHYYEKTHVEALYAQQMMNAMGLKSAIMVSSPYHMRRIRMISRKVFGKQSRLFSYVPTPYEKDPISIWKMDFHNWMFVIQELVKICWFRVYSLFA